MRHSVGDKLARAEVDAEAGGGAGVVRNYVHFCHLYYNVFFMG